MILYVWYFATVCRKFCLNSNFIAFLGGARSSDRHGERAHSEGALWAYTDDETQEGPQRHSLQGYSTSGDRGQRWENGTTRCQDAAKVHERWGRY